MTPAQVQAVVDQLFVALEHHYAGYPRLLTVLEFAQFAADEAVPLVAPLLPANASPRAIVDAIFAAIETAATGNWFLALGLSMMQRAVDAMLDKIFPVGPAPIPTPTPAGVTAIGKVC